MQVIETQCASILVAPDHLHINQMSRARTSAPGHGSDRDSPGSPEAQTAQKQHAGSLELDAQPPAARIRLPEGTARKVPAPARRAHIPDTSAASGPEPGPACPAKAATRRLRPVPLQRLPGAMISGAPAAL